MTVTRHRHGANEPLLAEMSQVAFAWVTGPAVVVLQVARRNDAEDADETQRAGFRTAKGAQGELPRVPMARDSRRPAYRDAACLSFPEAVELMLDAERATALDKSSLN